VWTGEGQRSGFQESLFESIECLLGPLGPLKPSYFAQANVPKEVPQGNRHKLAEGAWRPGKTKWHPGKLEDAASGAESGLLLGTVGHLELPITTKQVKRDIEFRVREVVEGILDVWDGIGIFLEQGVDSLVVYEKPEGPILLLD